MCYPTLTTYNTPPLPYILHPCIIQCLCEVRRISYSYPIDTMIATTSLAKSAFVTQPYISSGIYGVLLWGLQHTGWLFMGKAFSRPEKIDQLKPYGIEQTFANYFYSVNASGCLFAGAVLLQIASWPLSEARKQIAATAAALYGMWSVQNAIAKFRGKLFRELMWGNVIGCGICSLWLAKDAFSILDAVPNELLFCGFWLTLILVIIGAIHDVIKYPSKSLVGAM